MISQPSAQAPWTTRTGCVGVGLLGLLGLLWAGAAQATEGEVRKLDLAQGKVTLRHAEIKNLDMPPMTMVFRARPVTLLNGLAVGDRIDFDADKVDGQYVVTAIRKVR